MKRKEATTEYKWDFTHLYKNIDEWKKDLQKVAVICDEMAKLKNKLSKKENFISQLKLDDESTFIFTKLMQYNHLGDVDQTDTQFQELEGLLMIEYQRISIKTSFIAPELKIIGEATIIKWLEEEKELHKYIYGFKKFFKQEKHILGKHDEELLSKVSRSRNSVGNLYDSLAYADRQEVMITHMGKEVPLTQTLYMEILEDSDPIKDQEFRKEVSKKFGQNFLNKKHSFAKIYESILQKNTEEFKIRNYKSAVDASISFDAIPINIYEKLMEAGKKFIKPFKDYNLLIKNKYKFKNFYPTDRQLRLVKDYKKTFTVEQAKDVIRNALKIYGKEYLENLEIAWGKNKIDFYEDTNKRDGAYSSGGAGVEPIILMNWDDKLNSVNTLAHEIGHSVHTLFADKFQPYPLSEYPIILAEVASTLNEHLLFEYMYNNSNTNDEKIYLLQQRIFELCSTFYRQIQFADFEYTTHKLVEEGNPITADSLAKVFKEKELEYGYDIFDTSDKLSYGWPRISHFFHSPFYVYKYAIDVTASYKLYQDIKDGKIENALNFLKAGGHKDPLDIMLDSGIDFTKESTYTPLIDAISKMVSELTKLLK